MKILNLASKIVSAIAIFVAPIVVVWQRYKTETSTVTVQVNNGLGLVPTIFIALVVIVAVYFAASQFLEMVRTNKFGWLSIVFFGITLGLSLFGAWFVLNSILVSAQVNLNEFLATMDYHRQTMVYMIYPIVFGVGLGVIMKLASLKVGK